MIPERKHSAGEMAEAAKIIFEQHGGGDLATVITSMHLELCQRCAELEARLEKLEARKR